MNTMGKIIPKADADEGVGPLSDWWVPVWKGLVLDPQGRHYRAIGNAVWLLLYFFLSADRKTGTLKRKLSTISCAMGVKVRTIRLWLRSLRQGGYIEARTNGRCLVIAIHKWKSYPQGHSSVRQSDLGLIGRATQVCQALAPENGQKTAQSSEKSASGFTPYDRTIKKGLLTNDNVTAKASLTSRDVAIALEICQAFKDEKNLPLYLAYVKKYEMGIIQQAFKEAMKPPANKIKKTRGALFNYLVQYYAGEHDMPQNHSH